jgi:hypothetical protein
MVRELGALNDAGTYPFFRRRLYNFRRLGDGPAIGRAQGQPGSKLGNHDVVR